MYFWGGKTFWRKAAKPHLRFTEFTNNLGPDFKLKHIWSHYCSKHAVHVLEEGNLKLNNYKKPQAEPTLWLFQRSKAGLPPNLVTTNLKASNGVT